MVLYLEFLCQGLNSVVQEMGALIAHQNDGAAKSTDDVLKKELCSCSSITIPYCFSLFPSGEVLCSNDNISRASALSWWVDRTHKFYIPLVKCTQRNLHREGFPTLWKISQHLQKSLVSLCNVGHHNPVARIFCAVGFPAK